MISLDISVDLVNVNTPNGTAIITGVDLDELVGELNTQEVLQALPYSDVVEFVAEQEQIKKELDDERNA